jgi:RNA polymerase sigma-70 factor (ECF subfamily)
MYNGNTDKEIFFKESFERYYEKIVSYVYSFYKDRETAKNIAQDCFIAFWENIDKVESSKTPLPYLFFVAKNKTLNQLKRDGVEGKFGDYYAWREFELRSKVLSNSTVDRVLEKEVERLIKKSMEQMKDSVRDTFHLSRFCNMTNEEVAKELGISVKTVEYRMSSALRILKKNLRDFIPVIVILLSSLVNYE